MSPALPRLVASVLVCCVLSAIGQASRWPADQHNTGDLGLGLGLSLVGDDAASLTRWTDPIPGTKALSGFQEHGVIELGRRDCLPNGTNFCFGNDVNFCSGCGTCCADGIYCCGAKGTCCGTGCCAAG